MKTCFRCHVSKPLTDFYAHPMMADGRLGKCKECNKKDVRENYRLRIDAKREYDRRRYQTPERKAYASRQHALYVQRNPQKAFAHRAVGNALRDGKITRQPCQVCKSTRRVQAHHHDYFRPLDVHWLCFVCHRREHGQNPPVDASAGGGRMGS